MATLRSHFARVPLALAAAFAACSGASGQIATGPYTFELRTIASGLTAPVSLKTAPDNSGRLFVVDESGKIRIIQNGTLLPTPFLDITPLMVTLNPGYDERGLLGMAFHPQFATNGRFFIRYSRPRAAPPTDPCINTARGCHTEVLAEYTVSANPNIANPVGTVLLTVDKPQFNHDGGGVNFGPDGFLYMTLGDGGGANDGLADNPPSHGPIGNAQNLASPMGKLLRFDVSTPGVLAFPPSNPFLSTSGAYAGVYCYGLRNPYEFSFDDFGPAHTNQLILPDVGQNLFEEINLVSSPGQNFGWVIREGFHCFDPFAPNVPGASCSTAGLTDPIAEYPHIDPLGAPVGIAIIAGYVYRGGALPGLTGQYIFGDFSTAFAAADGHLFHTNVNAPAPVTLLRPKIGATNRNLAKYLKGMGRDDAGELYILTSSSLGPTGATGEVVKIVPCPADINGSATITVQDIFDFLALWFAGNPRADFNNANGVTVQDIFDFLAGWFGGC